MMPESLCLIACERRTLNVQVRATIASMRAKPSTRPLERHELKRQLERRQQLYGWSREYAALPERERLAILMNRGFLRDWPPPDAS